MEEAADKRQCKFSEPFQANADQWPSMAFVRPSTCSQQDPQQEESASRLAIRLPVRQSLGRSLRAASPLCATQERIEMCESMSAQMQSVAKCFLLPFVARLNKVTSRVCVSMMLD